MAKSEIGVQRPGASAGDQGPAAVVDRLLAQERRERRADAGLEEPDTLAAMLELEDRVDAVLGVQAGDLASPSHGSDPVDDVAKEAHDCSCGHIDVVATRGAQMD
jgi:hypothetical protein